MPFRLRVSTVSSSKSALLVSGVVVEGSYVGPESVMLCDKSGEWISSAILQHEVVHPKTWPIVAGDGSMLVLHIRPPHSWFQLDRNQDVVGRGSLSTNERRVDVTDYFANPAFWAIQMSLHLGAQMTEDPLLAWGFCQADEVQAYERLFESHWHAGVWPYLRLPFGGAKFVEIEFAAGVEYQERLWLGDGNASRALMGYHSGHFSLPSFRIAEVLALGKSLTAHPCAGLLLLPGAYIGADENLPRDIVSEWVKEVPGVRSEFIPKIVESFLSNVVPELQWRFDERLGWINNWTYSQRNPRGSMSVLGTEDFRFILQTLGQ